MRFSVLATTLIASSLGMAPWATSEPTSYGLGRPARADEIAGWNIDVAPDGAGLPEGHGGVAEGEAIFAEKCSACHGENGQGGLADRLVGGQGSLATTKPIKTVGSYWPYATTVFDYVRRAMPYTAPQSLSPDETYSLVAYLLWLNGVVPREAVLDRRSLPKIKMPNRGGFLPQRERGRGE
jgi:cytochrome c